jgi:CheY-like chemotaxis protein
MMVPLKILVAEDNAFNAELLLQLLLGRGHRGYVASNGDEAITLLENTELDLLFLDLRMPGRDGFEVIERIRDRERTTRKHLYVIALTARARKDERERCLAAGMDDFLVKPIDANALWAAIEKFAPAKDRDIGQWLDGHVLFAACGGDAVILDRIGQALRTHVPEELVKAEASWREGDAARLREAAHRLAGMVAVASSSVGSVASDLESEAAAGHLSEAGILLKQLRPMSEAVLSEMDRLSLDRLRELV